MKKLISCLLICAAFAGLYVPVNAEENAWREYYVATDGNDANPGTKEAPFKTVQAAKDAVRLVNKEMQGDIVVNISEGYYYLDQMLDFRVEDSGFNGHRVIYRGIGEDKPVISGGERVTGFKKSEYDGIYVADYAADDNVVLQLSVNGKRRYAAKAANLIKGVTKPEKYDTDEWYEAHPNDVDKDSYNYHNPETPYTYDGMYLSKKDFGFYENPEDILFVWDRCWVTNIVPVSVIEQDPDRSDVLRVTMQPGLWDNHRKNEFIIVNNTHPNPAREFTVMNAFELLDEPGEFYYNRKEKKLYYMPEENENMDDAVVIAPRLEMLVCIDGEDIDNKVKNITFDNLQFSDSQWDYNLGFSGQQATKIYGLSLSANAPRAIYVERADGIEFTNNIICNVGGSAIDYYNAVSNSKIVGNVIYDIGESAILSGARNHSDYSLGNKTREDMVPNSDGISDPVPAEFKNSAIDLCSVSTTVIHYSYYGMNLNPNAINPLIYPGFVGSGRSDETADGYYLNNVTWLDGAYNMIGDEVWRDDYSAKIGEKPYVTFEFMRPYSIDEVVISFNPKAISNAEKSDFEILVSNDKDFKEGTYKTLAVQNGAAGDLNHYKSDDDAKYKYVMFRKLSPSDFAMSRVWVTTNDRKPYVKNERCDGIVIENNIAQRVGVDVSRSIGMIITNGENYRVKHNEFIDVGYSGVSIGYTWNTEQVSCYNMDVGYNYVYDTCQTMHDGGGIYTLGPQPGSHYYNNYIARVNLGLRGFYTDNGTRYTTIENNYQESILHVLSPYVGNKSNGNGIIDNTFRNNFATHISSDTAGKDFNNYEEAKYTIIGQPQREAYDTYTNAGLEPRYEHIRNSIPEGNDNLYSRYDYYTIVNNHERSSWKSLSLDIISNELKYTLDNAQFGSGLGMYPAEYEDKLSDMHKYVISGKNPDAYFRAIKAKEFHEELKSVLNRYSFEDTLKLCKDLLSSAKGEDAQNYPSSSVAEFEKAISKAEGMSLSTPENEYDALLTLENAYNKMTNAKYSDMITRATVADAISTDINSEDNLVTIYVPKGYDMLTDSLVIETEGDSSVAGVIPSKVNLKEGINVPVYHKGTKEYRVWRVKAEEFDFDAAALIDKSVNWVQNTDEDGFIKRTKDFVSLSGNRLPYMSEKSGRDKDNTIVFAPMSKSETKSFNLILGANMSKEFDFGNTDSSFNHVQIEFKDDEASFYKVIDGNKTLIDTAKTGIEWNKKNTLTYEIKDINENSHFVVRLNGKLIFSEVIRKCSFGRFMGFYNPDSVIHIY